MIGSVFFKNPDFVGISASFAGGRSNPSSMGYEYSQTNNNTAWFCIIGNLVCNDKFIHYIILGSHIGKYPILLGSLS